VLIDGDQLTRLMIRHGVGCRIEETLYIKKVDEEFFEERREFLLRRELECSSMKGQWRD
jgi:hypothetical protein